jgi:hypothetical protein
VLDSVSLEARLGGVRDRIARAAGRAGREPSSVRLVAVSKTFPVEYVRDASKAGQIDFGENKVQEALPKISATASLPLRWHLIGHLQTNKVRKAASSFHTIHSIDGASLLRKVDEAATAVGRTIEVLVQVDLADEPTKYGAAPGDLAAILTVAAACRAARMRGLMLLPPAVRDPEQARPYFAALRRLRDNLLAQGLDQTMLGELSMGMSHDFEIAVEEGATLVRVGSAIFGERGGQ